MNKHQIIRRESGLPAVFSPAQLSAMAVGAVISYGVVSGSAFPLSVAGPAAVLSYVAAALMALLLMRCLSEMTAAYATPGGFASYAEAYLGARMGFVVRAAYVVSVVAIVGTEIAMLEKVFAWWFPRVPPALVVIGLLAGLNLVHLAGARVFAWVETALSVVKGLALIALIALACYHAFHAAPVSWQSVRAASVDVITDVNGAGLWEAFTIATMGFIGLEIMSIAAAETRACGSAIRRCLQRTTAGVAVLVVGAVAASAWFQWHQPVAPNLTPFVQLLEFAKLPGAQLAFTVLMAVTVVSVLNCQIYGGSRMVYSLARAGQAPASLARGRALRAPVTLVTWLALLVYGAHAYLPGTVYVAASSIAITSLLAIWGVIFASHFCFRRRAAGAWRGALGALGVLAITVLLVSTLWIEAFAPTLFYGVPFLLLLALLAWIIPSVSRGESRQCRKQNRKHNLKNNGEALGNIP